MSHPDSNSAEATVTAGEVAYNAYFKAVGGVISYGPNKGAPLPTWEEQNGNPDKAIVVGAWEAAANAVIAGYQHHQIQTGSRGHIPNSILDPGHHWAR